MAEKKSALITGAGQGIGRAVARKLASRGINVLIADLNETTGNEVVQELKDKFGVDSVFVKTDVSNEEDIKRMVTTAVDRWGRLDYAVNNAGLPEAMDTSEDNVTSDLFDKYV
jgi:NAD(P)-dependent dehydrogenase (short-subunit alcohol dehydrogenase family)